VGGKTAVTGGAVKRAVVCAVSDSQAVAVAAVGTADFDGGCHCLRCFCFCCFCFCCFCFCWFCLCCFRGVALTRYDQGSDSRAGELRHRVLRF